MPLLLFRRSSWVRLLTPCSATGPGAAVGSRTWALTSTLVTAIVLSLAAALCTALAVPMIVGPRIGKYTRSGTPNAMPGHDIVIVLTGCFILAFGWFGFNPGSTLGASGNGA